MRAEKQVRKMSRSEKRYWTVEMDEMKNKIDLGSKISFAHDKGLVEGRKEEKLAIARNLLAEGSTPEFVQKITGLSLEEIAKL